MNALDYVALSVLAFMVALVIGVLVFLGSWPGRVAAKRKHPYTTGVAVGGWATLLLGGIFFPLVLIWAYSGSSDEVVTRLNSEDHS